LDIPKLFYTINFDGILMTRKTIAGAVMAIAVVSMLAVTPAFATSFLDMKRAEVNSNSFEITTDAVIPQDGSAGAFGYAVFGANGVIAVTTHGGIQDSIAQVPSGSPVFHTHIVQLNTASNSCASKIEVTSASYNTVGKLEIEKNNIEVTGIPASAVGKLSNTVVSFTLSVENGAVCVNPHQALQANS
jgi:hypothetical protein